MGCKQESCNTLYYPRIDTVIVVLITSGEFCLVNNENIFITFNIGIGESIEQAIMRKTKEIVPDKLEIKFVDSQAMPNENSTHLIIGYIAKVHQKTNSDSWINKKDIRNKISHFPFPLAQTILNEWIGTVI